MGDTPALDERTKTVFGESSAAKMATSSTEASSSTEARLHIDRSSDRDPAVYQQYGCLAAYEWPIDGMRLCGKPPKVRGLWRGVAPLQPSVLIWPFTRAQDGSRSAGLDPGPATYSFIMGSAAGAHITAARRTRRPVV